MVESLVLVYESIKLKYLFSWGHFIYLFAYLLVDVFLVYQKETNTLRYK